MTILKQEMYICQIEAVDYRESENHTVGYSKRASIYKEVTAEKLKGVFKYFIVTGGDDNYKDKVKLQTACMFAESNSDLFVQDFYITVQVKRCIDGKFWADNYGSFQLTFSFKD